MLVRYLLCFETLFIATHIVTYSICQGLYNQPILEQQRMCQCLTPMSCVLPSSQTAWMEKLEKMMPSGISGGIQGIGCVQKSDPCPIQTAISTYIGMLDQAKSAWEVAALQGRGARQVQSNITEEEWRGSPVSIGPQPEDAGAAVEYGIDELLGTPNLEMSPGRRGANKTMFAWARDEDSEINVLTPSQELTCKLIWNQTIDIKVMKHNLFSVRGLPEFPDSEWVKVLQGKVVDLDVIMSAIHLNVTDNQATEMFGDFEFRFGHLKPTKTVRNHWDWAYCVQHIPACNMVHLPPQRVRTHTVQWVHHHLLCVCQCGRAKPGPQPWQGNPMLVWIC